MVPLIEWDVGRSPSAAEVVEVSGPPSHPSDEQGGNEDKKWGEAIFQAESLTGHESGAIRKISEQREDRLKPILTVFLKVKIQACAAFRP